MSINNLFTFCWGGRGGMIRVLCPVMNPHLKMSRCVAYSCCDVHRAMNFV